MKKIILLLFVLLPIQLFAVKGTDHYEGIIILDRTCPQIHVVSQTNHQVIAQESITIRGDYIESNLESITIGTQSCQIMTNARAFKLTNYPLVKGNNIIPMNASDLAGNHSAYTLVLFRQSDQFVILPGQTNIVTYSNLGLMIPPGAIQSNDVITVKVETNVGIPANLTSISPIFDLSKSSNNNCFDTPIEISIHYDPAKIPPGFTEEDIRIYVREKWQTEWAVTKFKSIDKINHIITAEIPCFSDYTVGALSQPDAPSSGSANGSGTGGLPAANPWTGIDQVTQPQPGPDGACHVSFPFRLLPMKFGPQPNMNLEYNSSVGFTVCGIGWDLPIDYIERSTKNGVPFYNNRDKFDHTGDDLVLTHGIWLTKQAGKYAKHIYNAGNDSWLVNDKNGNLYYYGTTPSSKENGTSLSNTSGTYRWYLTKIVDAYGNILENKYIVNGGKSYLQEIDYGGDNSSALARSITFEYEPRPDQLAFSTSGVNITNRNRLSRVHTGLEDYNLLYSTSLNSFRSLLTKVQVLNSGVLLYETALQYQQGKPSFTNACNANGNGISFTESQTHGAYLGDFNGDGSQELLCTLKSGSLILLHDIKYDAISNRFVNMGSSYSASFPENTSIVIGDFTGNGKDEIMNIDQSQITIGSLVNGASSRTFQTSYQYPYSVLPNGYTGDDVYIYDDPPWCNGYNIYRYFDLSSIIGVGDIDKTRKDTAAIGVYYDLVGVYFTGTSFKYSYITYQIVSYCFSKNGYVEATNLTGVSHYLFGSICDLSGMGNSKIAFFNKWNVCDQHALTDLNGDKKDDLIYSTYLANTDGQLGNIHIELSSNAGIPDPDDESFSISAPYITGKFWIGNFDGSGKNEILADRGIKGLSIYAFSGSNFQTICSNLHINTNGLKVCDLNGDGISDLINETNGQYRYFLNHSKPGDLLVSCVNSYGQKQIYSYTPNAGTPVIVQALSGYSKINQVYGTSLDWKFNYDLPKFVKQSNDFYGFGIVTNIDPSGLKTITYFNQADIGRGEIWRTDSIGSNDFMYKKVLTSYIHPPVLYSDSPCLMSLPTSVVSFAYEKDNGIMATKTTNSYDLSGHQGNLLMQIDVGAVNPQTLADIDPADNIRTSISYNYPLYPNGTEIWGQVSSVNTYINQVIPLRKSTAVYNYNDKSQCINASTQYESSMASVVSRFSYFQNGLLSISQVDSQTVYKYFFYDNYGQLITQSASFRDSKNQSQFFTDSYNYDDFGNLTKIIDINGLETSATYDEFGRVTSIKSPKDISGPGVLYTYRNFSFITNSVATKAWSVFTSSKNGVSGQWLKQYSWYDDFGRSFHQVKTHIQNASTSGYILSGNLIYDKAGRLIESGQPEFFANQYDWELNSAILPSQNSFVLNPTISCYDAIGRLTQVTAPNGTSIKTVYKTGQVQTFDQLNRCSVQCVNARGEVVTNIDARGNRLSMTYDSSGNLIQTTDPHGNKIQIRYNYQGQKIYMSDPDKGEWHYAYNTSGQLIAITNSKKEVVNYFYDGLARLTGKDTDGDGEADVSYYYDEGGASQFALGKLTHVTSPACTNYSRYDEAGNVICESNIMGGQAYTTRSTYDNLNRIVQLNYPDGESLSYAYKDDGLLNCIHSSRGVDYISAIEYNEFEQRTKVTLGNGAITTYGYNPLTTKLQSIQTVNGRGELIQSETMFFDAVGNIDATMDEVTDGLYAYFYDSLNRLTGFSFKYQISATNLTKTYSYNELGNIISKEDLNGYEYNSSKPHAVTSAGNYNFSYDPDGNMLRKTNFNTGFYQDIAWNSEGMVTGIFNNFGNKVTYAYDASGRRVRKDYNAGLDHIYVNSFYEVRSDGVICKSIFDGVVRIASEQVDSGGTKTFYFHSDHLGSSSLLTSEDGTPVQKISYTPFGETCENMIKDTNGNWITPNSITNEHTQYKFTGQEFDPETGFYNYNARLYDPQIGRFISADTIIPDPFDLQSYNRYSYCLNNPLKYTDPTGHDYEESSGSSYGYYDYSNYDWSSSYEYGGYGYGGSGSYGYGYGCTPDYGSGYSVGSGYSGGSGMYGGYNYPVNPSQISSGSYSSGGNNGNQTSFTPAGGGANMGTSDSASAGAWRNFPANPNWTPGMDNPSPIANWRVGLSGEVSWINPATGGKTWGYNIETSGLGLYNYITPNDVQSLGLSLGVSLTANVAFGSGSWEGPFHSISVNIGYLAFGGFWSPGVNSTNGYWGLFVGGSLGAPEGIGYTKTIYTQKK